MRDKDVLYNFDFSGLSSSYWVDTDKKKSIRISIKTGLMKIL